MVIKVDGYVVSDQRMAPIDFDISRSKVQGHSALERENLAWQIIEERRHLWSSKLVGMLSITNG